MARIRALFLLFWSRNPGVSASSVSFGEIWGPHNQKVLILQGFLALRITPTRCRDLYLKQFCLEDIVPAVLIVLLPILLQQHDGCLPKSYQQQ